MFEPNSIRSLLSRKQSARLSKPNGEEEKVTRVYDPEYEVLIENKLLLKDIDHQVDSIREWRQYQKAITEEKLKSNAQIQKIKESEYQNYLKREDEREKEETKKLMSQLDEKKQIKIVQEDEAFDSEKILSVLDETNNMREKVKNNSSLFVVNDQHEAFLHAFSNLNSIFKKDGPESSEKEESAKLSQIDLKNELLEIEKEFDQIQDLLK